MEFNNVYENIKRAESYSKLEFPGTYYLAYRDIPELLLKHVKGRKAIDFGCGAGRSTKFLQKYGFDTIGIDISEAMIKKAKETDQKGAYWLIRNNNFDQLKRNYFDLVFSSFTFDNIPNTLNRIQILKELGRLINDNGRIVLLESTPEIYINEWLSFSTKDFPENRYAKSGDKVKIIMTDVEDKRPVEDIIWFNQDYLDLFAKSDMLLIDTIKPLAKPEEPYQWVNETKIAPWVIYVLKKTATDRH
jgi:ubiquinone/menaquinone biosynthesis C-methylase UbiE